MPDTAPVVHTVEYVGGTEDDRAEVLRIFSIFWTANNTLDIRMLEPYWSERTIFFNSNGHVYHGSDEWKRVWEYYGARFNTSLPAELTQTTVRIDHDLAVVCDEGVRRGFGTRDVDEVSADVAEIRRIRATIVLARSGESWEIVHAHFSTRGAGPRPAFESAAQGV
ncbi:MAG: nuclear transport factor 2 family protein [Acidimicrobiia bacterium]